MAIRIIGTGSYAPEKILTNADLEKMVETSDEWITMRTGIKQRHIAADGVATSDLAVQAARRAMEMAKITPDQIDFISVATVTGDKAFPSTACFVQKKIEANKAVCYDVVAACSGLLYSLEIAVGMLRSYKKYKYALVIGAEKLSSIVDWQDRGTCVLFGDGASAVILERDDALPESEDCLIASELGAAGIYSELLYLPAGGSAMPASHDTVEQRQHYIKMNGQETFKLAVNGMVGACRNTMKESGVKSEDVAWVIPHQANLRIIGAVAQRLTIPEERVYVNIDKYGNTSAASIGICLDELCRAGKIKRGDYILLTAFGGGLTWGAMLIRW